MQGRSNFLGGCILMGYISLGDTIIKLERFRLMRLLYVHTGGFYTYLTRAQGRGRNP